MKNKKERFAGTEMSMAAAAALTLLLAGGVTAAEAGRSQMQPQTSKENQMTTTQTKFFCNIKALTPEERAHHKQLGDKLMAARKEIIEMPNGYEFQFSPKNVTLAELADWVVDENKCCPFFNFHIDLENEGALICLRLTGEEGIKQFIRGEFLVK
jgi:hypothetical protein